MNFQLKLRGFISKNLCNNLEDRNKQQTYLVNTNIMMLESIEPVRQFSHQFLKENKELVLQQQMMML